MKKTNLKYLFFLLNTITLQNTYSLTNFHTLTKKLKSQKTTLTFLPSSKTPKTLSAPLTNFLEDYKKKLKDLFFQELSQREKRASKKNSSIPLTYKKPGLKISRPISMRILNLLNNYRSENNLEKIKWNENVYRLTLDHSYYMEEKKIISHDNLVNRIGGLFEFANENVAMFGGAVLREEEAARKFFDMWRFSEGHDKNMKEERVREGAIGMVVNYDTREYYSTMILVK